VRNRQLCCAAATADSSLAIAIAITCERGNSDRREL
jgi:hypothetical protein